MLSWCTIRIGSRGPKELWCLLSFMKCIGIRILSSSKLSVQFSSVESRSCVWLFVTPWTTARQASLSITNSQSLLKLMYGCESCTIKKAEHWRTDAFELWSWRRLSRVCWTARRSNQSILKKISPEYSLEGLMLKLKLQYFCHLMRKTDSLKKTLILERLKAGGEGDDRGWDGWMASLTHGHNLEKTPGVGEG